ncbi:hypothetical protein VNO77_47735 [Canavalia gladiata]|uniref:Uncharacterized protein n=1 Tax=Canavalia gladiata TaxID=3824 RepID=A0AAN9PHY5_CANGL
MTLSNRSRFADDVVKESTPLCTRIGSLYGWTEGLSQTRFNSFFAGIPGSSSREEKRKRNSLLSSYSFSLPCGGLSGVYGGSDQSREEVFSDLPLRKVSSRQLKLPGLSCVSVTKGPFIDGRTTGIEPARGGFTIHCLDPLGYIRPYPRTGAGRAVKARLVESKLRFLKRAPRKPLHASLL